MQQLMLISVRLVDTLECLQFSPSDWAASIKASSESDLPLRLTEVAGLSPVG